MASSPHSRRLLVAVPLAAFLLGLAPVAPTAIASVPVYPEAPTGSVVDDYHGTSVPDPYRWLETADAPETQAWVEAQNATTRSYLDPIPGRDHLRARLTELLDYERFSPPYPRGERIFFTRNAGLQNQSVWYVQQGLDGERRELLDPNRLREDGTGAVRAVSISEDGRYMAYGVSWSGSDWTELRIRDVETGADLPEVIEHTKFTQPAWLPDASGFYYSRQPAPGSVPEGEEHYYMKLRYHRLGDDPEADRIVHERPDQKELGFSPTVTRDGAWLIVHVWKGSADKNEMLFARLGEGAETLRPLMEGFDAAYHLIGYHAGTAYFRTNVDAPNYKIVAVDLERPERANWTTIVPEGRDLLERAVIARDRLLVGRLHNAHGRLDAYALDGTHLHEVKLPTVGTLGSLIGRPGDDRCFFSFTSFFHPSSTYRYDFESGRVELFRAPEVEFEPGRFTARQVWYESKDGTKVSMFLAHKKGLVLDGNNPVLLYGYGGFNISMKPYFSASRILWLEQGGVLAVANLRGGGEYGETWHEAGMLERKQNVFDDFIAAGEYLIDHGYTRTERLAIQGGSNGGLLTAACMVQRPDLFGVVLTQVPVVDMLRYHRFTVARYWIPEYGSSENPEQFEFLKAYSPLHNLKPGTEYPSTLITTADTDDRVDPGQAKKYAATLQAANASDRPTLIRIETRAGHGGGKPTAKRIEASVDVYGFVLHEMGLTVDPTP